MSIQDDIFDVEAALEGKPEAEVFERLCSYLSAMEREVEIKQRILDQLRDGARAISKIMAM